jgi:hypothetical protein
MDIITLRPEVELCYMGISQKCFEILENRPHDDMHSTHESHAIAANVGQGPIVDEDDDDDGSDEDEDEDEDEEDEEDGMVVTVVDPDETESEISDPEASDEDYLDSDSDEDSKAKLKLREILFYEDKVAIFKARHGRL